MTEQRTLTRAGLKTPRAAAIAGMVFSVLLIVVFWLLRSAVPADPQEPGSWLNTASGKIALALNLVHSPNCLPVVHWRVARPSRRT
jgi:hypothetical protein